MLYRPGLLGRLPCPQDWYFGSGPPTIDDAFTGSTLPGSWVFTRASANATNCLYTDGVTDASFRTYNTNEARLLPFGLLMEPQRTNLFLNSEAPATQNISLSAGTYTVWMQGTGTVVVSGSGLTPLSGSPTQGVPYTFTAQAGTTATVAISAPVTRVQFELGNSATSYIVSGPTAQTRAEDRLSQNFFGGQINQQQGTYWVEFMWNAPAYAPAPLAARVMTAGIGSFSSDANSDQITMTSYSPTINYVNGVSIDQANNFTNITSNLTPTRPFGSVNRVAMSVSPSRIQLAMDYVLAGAGNTPVRPTSMLVVTLGCGGAQAMAFNGFLRGFKYWRTAMPDSELKECTGAGYYRSGPVFDFDFTTGVFPRQLTYTRTGALNGVITDSFITDAPGSTYNTYAATVPRIFAQRGLLMESIRYNYYGTSNTPGTRVTAGLPVAMTIGAWMVGTGSITISNGTGTIGTVVGSLTVTQGQIVKFVMATTGNINVTVTGSVNRVMVEAINQNIANLFALAPTSFIQTVGAPQSRNNDYVTMPIRGWYNIDQSTYYIECVPLGPSTGFLFPISCWSSVPNREQIFLNTPDATTVGNVTNVQGQSAWTGGTGLNGVLSDPSITNNAAHKLAYALSAITGVRMQGQLAKDGVAGIVTNAGDINSIPQPYPTTFSLNGNAAGGGGNFYIRRVRYYDYQMTGDEIATLTTNPGPSLDISFLSGSLDRSIVFTRNSTATYFDVNGTMQSAAINAPRFDYDPVSHAARGLLIEEARTNSLLNSATLGTQSVAVTAQPYTLSFYGTGTVTLSGASTAGPLVGTGAFPTRVALTFTPTAGTLTLTVSGSVLNANLEAGSFATSYIPTTAAAVTRVLDVANIPVASIGGFDQTRGSLQAEYIIRGALVNYGSPMQFIGASANTDYITLDQFYAPGGTATTPLVYGSAVSGQGYCNYDAGIPAPAGAVQRGVMNWVLGGQTRSAHNGALATVMTGVNASLPTITNLSIATRYNFQSPPSIWIRRIRYWPRVLSDTEMQQVTT